MNSRYAEVPGYGLLNARIGLRTDDGLWDVSVFARNLANKHYYQTLSAAPSGYTSGILGEPRTWGVTFRTRL
jgi:iron complex outermembrane receptor protein